MSNIIKEIEKSQVKSRILPFTVGDTIKVSFKILEGDKERLQAFQGTVIARKGSGINEAVTLRRMSHGEGVERVFLLNSPKVGKIQLIKTGSTRRAKLYYLRDKVGKKARLKDEKHVAGLVEEDTESEAPEENLKAGEKEVTSKTEEKK